MNTKNTITNASPLPMDNQGRWYEILSPTQVLSGDEHEQQQQQQLQDHEQEKEKKKCRGDRKAQRQRRRLRRQAIDPDTTTNLDYETLNVQQQQDDEIRKDLPDEIEICIPFDRVMFFLVSFEYREYYKNVIRFL